MIQPSVKKILKNILLVSRIVSGKTRTLPHFLIIGAQRSGTTSLFNYIIKHPSVKSPLVKEIHYFDLHYDKGVEWYRAHFPRTNRMKVFLTGESSPYYLFHPHVPKRIAHDIPDVKLILILRNPIDRALSHYYHEVRMGRETLSFEDAVQREDERLREESDILNKDENYYSFAHHRFSYISRGEYVDQIENWLRYFDLKQMLILQSEKLLLDPSSVLNKVFHHLELPPWALSSFKKYHKATYPAVDSSLRERLIDHYRPFNDRLYDVIGARYDWEN